MKAELSDVEGLGFKLEERQKDILELKKALKMKVGNCNSKLKLMSSKVTELKTQPATGLIQYKV